MKSPKEIAEAQRAAKAEPLTLPSGIVVMASRPEPMWWLRNVGRLPQSMGVKLLHGDRTSSDEPATREDLISLAHWTDQILNRVIVSPKLKLNAGPDELDPNDISDEDLRFLLRYAGGEVAADGQSLERFPDKRNGGPSPVSAAGEDLGREAKRAG